MTTSHRPRRRIPTRARRMRASPSRMAATEQTTVRSRQTRRPRRSHRG
jgi:hypothetical protein